jgi:hypothetical protein
MRRARRAIGPATYPEQPGPTTADACIKTVSSLSEGSIARHVHAWGVPRKKLIRIAFHGVDHACTGDC